MSLYVDVVLHANCKNVAFEMKNLSFKKGAFKRFLKPVQNALFSILKLLVLNSLRIVQIYPTFF